MAGFRFRLEGVLRHRRDIERDRKRELAEALALLATLQEELAGIARQVRQADADLRGTGLAGRLDMAFLAAHRRFVASMHQKAVAVAHRIRAAQARVDQARSAAVEAATERKVIEKLRERKLAAWMESANRQQELAFDEINTRLYLESPAATPGAAGGGSSGHDRGET